VPRTSSDIIEKAFKHAKVMEIRRGLTPDAPVLILGTVQLQSFHEARVAAAQQREGNFSSSEFTDISACRKFLRRQLLGNCSLSTNDFNRNYGGTFSSVLRL
jgi:hypothetical protein